MRGLRWALRLLVVGLLLIACGAAYEAIAERRDLARFSPPGRLVDIGGRRLHLLCSGAGSPVVILEASGLGTYRDWINVQPAIARETQVCSYDRAGLGWSDPGPLPRDATHLADDLGTLLERANVPPPYVLVGHSAGGFPARLYTAMHAGRVKGLVLVDTAPPDMADELPAVYARMRRTTAVAPLAARFGLMRLVNPFGLVGEDHALTYRTSVYAATASLIESFPADAAELASAPPLSANLPLVVVTHGRGGDWAGPGSIPDDEAERVERAWQTAQARLAALSESGHVLVAPKSGHMIPAEQPDVVIAAIREVLTAARRQ
jgi:pimeloyl-ACP methyl ester carboxylesterase